MMIMLKYVVCLMLLSGVICLSNRASGQRDSAKASVASSSIKLTSYWMLHGGWGLSLGVGLWRDSYVGIWRKQPFRVQPGANTSLNFSFDQQNIGNRNRDGTRSQINLVFSPIITIGSRVRGYAEELHPFYFGNANAVYTNYRHSATIGSSFVLAPRSRGRNVFSSRNRTQQLFYVAPRIGFGEIVNLQIHVYDDFLGTDSPVLNAFADNYDRFFSGGGNIQLRISRNFKLRAYSEVYTGSFQRDMFDFPDLYLPRDSLYRAPYKKFPFFREWWPRTVRRKRGRFVFFSHPRYVAQEPGQKVFNVGRTFGMLEYSVQTHSPSLRIPFSIIVGDQGGHYNMWSQNLIHNHFRGLKIVPSAFSSDSLYTTRWKSNGGSKGSFERLHHFYPAAKKGRLIIGFSSDPSSIPYKLQP